MKRFYKQVAVVREQSGFGVQLDGRPVKTLARNELILPTQGLAQEIANEWDAQEQDIDPETMPLNALAHGALDQVADERERIVGRICAFADSDMIYYRADEDQSDLTTHQAEQWDPLLEWARTRFDVSFTLVHGIIYQSQSPETISRLSAAVGTQDDFALAAMLSISGLTGSLVATLALIEDAFDDGKIWTLSNLEELWQERQWGRDELAQKKRDAREAEFQAAVKFLRLSRV